MEFADHADRVTVLDLMADASASTPELSASPAPAAAAPPPQDEDLNARVERLSGELERLPDPAARAVGEELVAAVLELHGEGLAQMLALADEETVRAFGADSVAGSLLLIHGLHPVPLEQRVAQALESVRPYMASHGGGVELLGIEDGVVHLRLEGSCQGCAASSATLELAIQNALMEAAPDLAGMDVEGTDADGESHPPPTGTTGPALPMAGDPSLAPAPAAPSVSGWAEVNDVAALAPGATAVVERGGVTLLVANVGGTLLAYLDRCASCGASLASAPLHVEVLACEGCGAQFDLPRAGRSPSNPALQLGPVPLLREGPDRVRVALPS